MTTGVGSSPDFMFTSHELTYSLDEEGVLDAKLTPKEIRERLAYADVDVKDTNSKALSEVVDDYPSTVYHRFSDKRFLTGTE